MWITLFALATAASVCLGMVSFAVQTYRDQAILNSSATQSQQMTVEHPTGEARHPG